MTATTIRAAALFCLVTVAGCDRIDPYQREGVWRPRGVNDANLTAMVVVPSDLVHAMPLMPGDGGHAAAAASRLRHDRVRPLLDSGLARVVPVAGGAAQQPAAAPAGNGE